MHRALILAAALAALSGGASGHTLFPGRQVVETIGERAFVRFQAANARRDVSQFVVEVFEDRSWTPARLVVASPPRFFVPAPETGSTEASERVFSILVDLDGNKERRLRVCTKSVVGRTLGKLQATRLNTRVCASVLVRKFSP